MAMVDFVLIGIMQLADCSLLLADFLLNSFTFLLLTMTIEYGIESETRKILVEGTKFPVQQLPVRRPSSEPATR